MKRPPTDGRAFVAQLTAGSAATDDGGVELRAPAVGLWRGAPAPGSRLQPGDALGELEILGVLHRLVVPADAIGIVAERAGPRLARQPVEYGQVLLTLERGGPDELGTAGPAAEAGASGTGLYFRAPLSGRYYARPSPDAPAFVQVGDVIDRGQTVALLEVMKTFNRVTYGGDELPPRARVIAIPPADGDDVDEGDVIIELEAG